MRFLAIALCLVCAAQMIASDTDVSVRRKQLNDLIAEYWEYSLKQSPVYASIIGDKRYNDQLGSDSEASIKQDAAKKREYLAKFQAISTEGLPQQEKLNRELEIRDIQRDLGYFDLNIWQSPVSQIGGVHLQLPQLVSVLSFQSVKDYTDYISRLRQIPRVFDENIGVMRLGMASGMMPPKFLLEKVADQANGIASAAAEQSPFAEPFQKFPESFSEADKKQLKTDGLAAIQNEVNPAYAKFAAFVKNDYAPKGRSEVGVWSLPNGDAIYRFMVRQSTTTDVEPEKIHQIGLQQVAEIEEQMQALAKKMGYKDFKGLAAAMVTDPKLHGQSREQILDLYSHYIDQMKPKLPALFGRLPKADVIVMPVEKFREKDAPDAQYVPGTPDGSRPGHVMVNTGEPQKRSLTDVEATAYHEGVPGHHLQLAIAQEVEALPPFRQHGFWGAYIEGWALYSERLGKEVGFYQDPYQEYGRLESEMWRAIRLVVDTGLHYKHWTREQVVQYFHDHSAIDEISVQSETNRYISWPGQALSYKMGQLQILDLRAKAQKELGTNFDIREFHDQIIDSGALPLDVLAAQIDDWIAQKKASTAKK
jgi:uncharacterized protein (DUF885 family)